jgi:hypothetical protein
MPPTDELNHANHVPVDEDAPGPPISVPDSGDHGEGGKLKMIVQLVKKCLGVKDIAAMFVQLSLFRDTSGRIYLNTLTICDPQASFITSFSP